MQHDPEKRIDRQLIRDDRGRKINSDVGDSTWGQLILPSPAETAINNPMGMRVVLFSSYILGFLLLETLKEMQRLNPGRFHIAGLVTDDPASPAAKISAKKRIWGLYNQQEIITMERAMIESGLSGGIPVYTGAVKTGFFRNLLKQWNPDVILTNVFGQLVDESIIGYPPFDIYNFHPSDLLAGHGAGPRPFQDLIERNASSTKLTLHQLTLELDSGPVVAQSPPVNVRYPDGTLPTSIFKLEDKILHTVDILGAFLMKTLVLQYEDGKKGLIKTLEVEHLFTDEIRQTLLQPVSRGKHLEILPRPSRFVDYRIP